MGHPIYDGGKRWCNSPNVSVRMTWISLGTLTCRKKKWQFASPSYWNRARRLTWFLSASVTRNDLQFGTCTDPPPLSNDIIDSVLRHGEVCRAKNLSAPRRTYINTYTYACIHTYVHTYRHKYINIHTHVYIYKHAYIQTYIHTYIHTDIHMLIYTYIQTYINTYNHTYKHTRIYT